MTVKVQKKKYKNFFWSFFRRFLLRIEIIYIANIILIFLIEILIYLLFKKGQPKFVQYLKSYYRVPDRWVYLSFYL